MNGLRTADEILAGYSSAGRDDPPAYLVARVGGEPVGVGIVVTGPQPGFLELSYLGLVPAARGRRLGTELLRHVLGGAAGAGTQWVILSVDVRNTPALRLYREFQFKQYDLQDVYIWRPNPEDERHSVSGQSGGSFPPLEIVS
jgi:ribosomal protein S18 acetylase RimI-like enzyme